MFMGSRRVKAPCMGFRFMITQHPEVEAKVLAELDALGLLVTPERPNPRLLEYDDLTKLTYTNNCIKVSALSSLAPDSYAPHSVHECDWVPDRTGLCQPG